MQQFHDYGVQRADLEKYTPAYHDVNHTLDHARQMQRLLHATGVLTPTYARMEDHDLRDGIPWLPVDADPDDYTIEFRAFEVSLWLVERLYGLFAQDDHARCGEHRVCQWMIGFMTGSTKYMYARSLLERTQDEGVWATENAAWLPHEAPLGAPTVKGGVERAPWDPREPGVVPGADELEGENLFPFYRGENIGPFDVLRSLFNNQGDQVHSPQQVVDDIEDELQVGSLQEQYIMGYVFRIPPRPMGIADEAREGQIKHVLLEQVRILMHDEEYKTLEWLRDTTGCGIRLYALEWDRAVLREREGEYLRRHEEGPQIGRSILARSAAVRPVALPFEHRRMLVVADMEPSAVEVGHAIVPSPEPSPEPSPPPPSPPPSPSPPPPPSSLSPSSSPLPSSLPQQSPSPSPSSAGNQRPFDGDNDTADVEWAQPLTEGEDPYNSMPPQLPSRRQPQVKSEPSEVSQPPVVHEEQEEAMGTEVLQPLAVPVHEEEEAMGVEEEEEEEEEETRPGGRRRAHSQRDHEEADDMQHIQKRTRESGVDEAFWPAASLQLIASKAAKAGHRHLPPSSTEAVAAYKARRRARSQSGHEGEEEEVDEDQSAYTHAAARPRGLGKGLTLAILKAMGELRELIDLDEADIVEATWLPCGDDEGEAWGAGDGKCLCRALGLPYRWLDDDRVATGEVLEEAATYLGCCILLFATENHDGESCIAPEPVLVAGVQYAEVKQVCILRLVDDAEGEAHIVRLVPDWATRWCVCGHHEVSVRGLVCTDPNWHHAVELSNGMLRPGMECVAAACVTGAPLVTTVLETLAGYESEQDSGGRFTKALHSWNDWLEAHAGQPQGVDYVHAEEEEIDLLCVRASMKFFMYEGEMRSDAGIVARRAFPVGSIGILNDESGATVVSCVRWGNGAAFAMCVGVAPLLQLLQLDGAVFNGVTGNIHSTASSKRVNVTTREDVEQFLHCAGVSAGGWPVVAPTATVVEEEEEANERQQRGDEQWATERGSLGVEADSGWFINAKKGAERLERNAAWHLRHLGPNVCPNCKRLVVDESVHHCVRQPRTAAVHYRVVHVWADFETMLTPRTSGAEGGNGNMVNMACYAAQQETEGKAADDCVHGIFTPMVATKAGFSEYAVVLEFLKDLWWLYAMTHLKCTVKNCKASEEPSESAAEDAAETAACEAWCVAYRRWCEQVEELREARRSQICRLCKLGGIATPLFYEDVRAEAQRLWNQQCVPSVKHPRIQVAPCEIQLWFTNGGGFDAQFIKKCVTNVHTPWRVQPNSIISRGSRLLCLKLESRGSSRLLRAVNGRVAEPTVLICKDTMNFMACGLAKMVEAVATPEQLAMFAKGHGPIFYNTPEHQKTGSIPGSQLAAELFMKPSVFARLKPKEQQEFASWFLEQQHKSEWCWWAELLYYCKQDVKALSCFHNLIVAVEADYKVEGELDIDATYGIAATLTSASNSMDSFVALYYTPEWKQEELKWASANLHRLTGGVCRDGDVEAAGVLLAPTAQGLGAIARGSMQPPAAVAAPRRRRPRVDLGLVDDLGHEQHERVRDVAIVVQELKETSKLVQEEARNYVMDTWALSLYGAVATHKAASDEHRITWMAFTYAVAHSCTMPLELGADELGNRRLPEPILEASLGVPFRHGEYATECVYYKWNDAIWIWGSMWGDCAYYLPATTPAFMAGRDVRTGRMRMVNYMLMEERIEFMLAQLRRAYPDTPIYVALEGEWIAYTRVSATENGHELQDGHGVRLLMPVHEWGDDVVAHVQQQRAGGVARHPGEGRAVRRAWTYEAPQEAQKLVAAEPRCSEWAAKPCVRLWLEIMMELDPREGFNGGRVFVFSPHVEVPAFIDLLLAARKPDDEWEQWCEEHVYKQQCAVDASPPYKNKLPGGTRQLDDLFLGELRRAALAHSEEEIEKLRIHYFDFHSSYPSTLMNTYSPCGKPTVVRISEIDDAKCLAIMDDCLANHQVFMCRCSFEAPADCYIPVVGARARVKQTEKEGDGSFHDSEENKLLFQARGRGVFHSEDIALAQKHGYKFSCITQFVYWKHCRDTVMKQYMGTCYARKCAYSKRSNWPDRLPGQSDEEHADYASRVISDLYHCEVKCHENSARCQTAKLNANCPWGKMGEKEHSTVTLLFRTAAQVLDAVDNKVFSHVTLQEMGSEGVLFRAKYEGCFDSTINTTSPVFAAGTTASARAHLTNDIIEPVSKEWSPLFVIAGDTDSGRMICTPEIYASRVGWKCGMLGAELKTPGIRECDVGSKTYCIVSEPDAKGNVETVLRAKGCPREFVTEGLMFKHVSRGLLPPLVAAHGGVPTSDDYVVEQATEKTLLKFQQMRTKLSGDVEMTPLTKNFRNTVNGKRVSFRLTDGVCLSLPLGFRWNSDNCARSTSAFCI